MLLSGSLLCYNGQQHLNNQVCKSKFGGSVATWKGQHGAVGCPHRQPLGVLAAPREPTPPPHSPLPQPPITRQH